MHGGGNYTRSIMRLVKVLFVGILLFFSVQGQASKYKFLEVRDSISIFYKWVEPGRFARDKSPQLLIRFENMAANPVSLAFTVSFYQDGLLHQESETFDLCLKAKGYKSGRIHELVFPAKAMSMQDIESDGFDWELNDWEVTPEKKCK